MTFSRIYRKNIWNGVESRSGPGSGTAATAIIKDRISELAKELGIQTTLDVGCGDNFWMPDLPDYVGVDVAPEAIARARLHHPERSFMVADIRYDHVGPFDLVICRDAIQHLSLADGTTLLKAIWATGSRWLLASTYTDGENIDVKTGGFYRPDLTAEPFNLGAPERLIFDGYDYAVGTEARDPGKHLGLWRLLSGYPAR